MRHGNIVIQTIACFLLSVTLMAEAVTGHVTRIDEYKTSDINAVPDSLNSDLLGDNVDLNTGELSFRHVDVDLIGNSNLPVRVARTLNGTLYQVSHFSSWALEIPTISLRIERGGTWWNDRCTNPHGEDREYAFYYSSAGLDPLKINIPGEDSGNLLTIKSSEDNEHFGADRPAMTTLKFSRVECVDNGAGPESFEVTTTNGNVYIFDKEFTFSIGRYEQPETRESVYTDLKVLYPSEVRDVHGNWVRYTYSATNKGPTRIYSNDGRDIQIRYEDPTTTQISSVTTNGRTWTYERSYNSVKNNLRVIRPDGSYWQIGNPWAITYRSETGCSFIKDFPFYIKHPNGVEGTFSFKKIINFITGVPHWSLVYSARNACGSTPDGSRLGIYGSDVDGRSNFFTHAVVQKSLSLPSGEVYDWHYEYDEGDWFSEYKYNIYEAEAKSPAGLSKLRTVVDPTGRMIKSWYHRHWVSVGDLARKEVYESKDSATPLQTIEYEYKGIFTSDKPIGGAYLRWSQPQPPVTVPNFLVKTTTTMHTGDVYIDEHEINQYGHSTKQTLSSNLSGSPTKVITRTYEHDTSNWILGLEKTVSINHQEVARNNYTEKGLVKEEYQFGHLVNSYTYHASGKLKTHTNGIGKVTRFDDWKLGTAQKVTQADGTIISRLVNDDGWVTKFTDAILTSANYSHDNMGRVTNIDRNANWHDTEIDYDFEGGGLVQTVTTGELEETIRYDGLLRPVLKTTKDLSTGWQKYVNTRYDSAGRVSFTSQPSLISTESKGIHSQYDGLDRVVQKYANYAPFAKISYEYLDDNRVQETDANEYVTTSRSSGYGSPDDGELMEIISPESVQTTMGYNSFGNITSVTQSGNQDGYNVSNTHRYYYDSRQRLCRHHVPELGSKLFEYNNAMQLISYSEGQPAGSSCQLPSSGKVSLYYDDMGRLTLTDFPSGTPDVVKAYDANGRVTRIARGSTQWAYSYYDNNALKSETLSVDGLNFETTYNRDKYGNIAGIYYPSSDYVSFSPNALGMPSQASFVESGTSANYASDVTYYPNGLLKNFTYGNGVIFEQTLNAGLLPETRSAKYSAGVPRSYLMDLTYGYDAVGNVLQISDALDSSRSISNTYDGLNRLKTSLSGRGDITFTYDPLGNLRKRQVVGGSAHGGAQHNVSVNFNGTNQVSSALAEGSTATYQHDGRGNVINNGKHTFSYDFANQPTAINGSQTGSFVYDGNFKRVKATVNGETIYSVYTLGAGLISQYNKTKSIHTDHIRILDTTVARVESLGSHADPSVPAFNGDMPQEQSIAERPHYLPYGKRIDGSSPKENAIGYTGHIEDDSGLIYMQARYYDPVIGRFYSNDPVGALAYIQDGNTAHGFNRYVYANNNPYRYTDPNGLCPKGKLEKYCLKTSEQLSEESLKAKWGSYTTDQDGNITGATIVCDRNCQREGIERDRITANDIAKAAINMAYQQSQTELAIKMYETAEFASYGVIGVEMLGYSAAKWSFMKASEKIAYFSLVGEVAGLGVGVDGSAAYVLQTSKVMVVRMRVSTAPGKPKIRAGSYLLE